MLEVKFCENNFQHGTDAIVEKLKENHEDVKVEVESCLGDCGECANGPFAVLDGQFIQADTPDELYELIENEIG